MPKVSVIIPVYGVEKYIERCARSLFEQTLDDIEYLFIDDCTPDKSIDVLLRLLEDYPNRKNHVIIHQMEQNSGQAKVRKWGMMNATGDYLIHCDSDDWVDSSMYEAMYDKAKNDNADIVVCDYYEVSGDKRRRIDGKKRILKNEFLSDILCLKVASSVCNKLIKKSLLNDSFIYPQYNMGEDLLMTVQLVNKSSKVAFVDEAYYYYINNPSSIVHDKTNRITIIRNSFNNINAVCEYIEHNTTGQYANELIYLKWRQRHYIIPYIKDRQTYNLYLSSFPNLSQSVYTCDLIPLKERIRTALMETNLGYWLNKTLNQ